MRKLIAGIHRFQKRYWSANRELYRRLAEHGQFPEALFITCSDARVDPVTITHGWSTPSSTWRCGTSSSAGTPTAGR
jgi:carbonic anhydrase